VNIMDRRRFLKYAAATMAVVGASALGLDYFLNPRFSNLPQTTTSSVPIVSTLSSQIVPTQTYSVKGRVFFDYSGNGKQDGEEPAVPKAKVQLRDSLGNVIAEADTDSSGDYHVDIPAGNYRFSIKPNDPKFRHTCTSPAEFRPITDGYDLAVTGPETFDIGLMEGYLTMIASAQTNFVIDRFFDHDPNPNTYLWWNGQRGFDKDLPRGYSPNHPGIDYFMSEGNILLAQAPGTCRSGEDEGGKYIFVTHPNGYMTSHGHISKSLVEDGTFVSRGQPVAVSGKSGATTEAANYTHDHVGLYFDNRYAIDQYSPEFNMTSQYAGYYDGAKGYAWIPSTVDASPNLENHWTKYNDPQYAVTSSTQ